ncbi:sulfite exporter TauE/SafE family protein [Nocardiopsis mangrovi]|uniref:Probable membrane transporter protein n=1 Tax=Nocardiopsis mangrovi TaxID=1179818 RepID=A0ABV9E3Y4_9ACTN
MILGPWELALLVVAGVGAGLTGSIAGLASLVSYPALLAVGLPPVAANVTNTVSLTGSTLGAVMGSRPELTGQWGRLRRLCLITATGGAAGGALMLSTPPELFQSIVPWLIGGASIMLLFGQRLRAALSHRGGDGIGPVTGVAAFAVAVYGGYFGAAAGVLMLALLSTVWSQSLARTNAAKNIATGSANLIAAAVFAAIGPVHWPAATALCAGSLVGAWIGPWLVRRLPAAPLRYAICAAGLALAVHLSVQG